MDNQITPARRVIQANIYKDVADQAVTEFLSVWNMQAALHSKWWGLICEINGVCKAGAGQVLRKLLRELSPKLAEAAVQYVNTLIRIGQHPHVKQKRLVAAELRDHIEGVRSLTSSYQDEIEAILEGRSTGAAISKKHAEEDFYNYMAPIDLGIDRGGAPEGIRPANRLLAEKALTRREEAGGTWQDIAVWLLANLSDSDPVEYEAKGLLDAKKYTGRGSYLQQQVKRYKKTMSKTGF